MGRRRKARTETAAWAFPSTSVSAGRDSPDGNKKKEGWAGLQRQQEALNILREKATELKEMQGWKEGGYT